MIRWPHLKVFQHPMFSNPQWLDFYKRGKAAHGDGLQHKALPALEAQQHEIAQAIREMHNQKAREINALRRSIEVSTMK